MADREIFGPEMPERGSCEYPKREEEIVLEPAEEPIPVQIPVESPAAPA